MKEKAVPILLVSVFITAICGILYELLCSTISTYFLGAGILHFSLTIGIFLTFMGVGSWLSRYVKKDLLTWFINAEILLGIIGGLSTFILYLAFALTKNYYLISFVLIGTLGGLIGLEIPILVRILRKFDDLRQSVSQVLSFDYLGSLIASVVFPLVLLPYLGTMKTAFVIGLLNLGVAVFNTWIFRKELPRYWVQLSISLAAMVVFVVALVVGNFVTGLNFTRTFEKYMYQDEVILARQSPYQRIIMTQWRDDTRLFLNGNLQFSTVDEFRYHEPLIHVPFTLLNNRERILILGGGDGLALREIWKYEGIQQVDMVDLDPKMTNLGKENGLFHKLNKKSMQDSRLTIYNEDAWNFIANGTDLYSLIIIDLPDPNDPGLGKLYSREFYKYVDKRLTPDGIMVTQSTSPFFAREVFWCIHHTMEEIFPVVVPYTAYVPSFGQWGFNMAMKTTPSIEPVPFEGRIPLTDPEAILRGRVFANYERTAPDSLRYLSPAMLPVLFEFSPDISELETEIQTLDQQKLIQYYERSWKHWN